MTINMSEIDYAAMLREESKRMPHGQREAVFEALVDAIESGNAEDEIDCAPADLLRRWSATGSYETISEIAALSDDDPALNPAEVAAEVFPCDHFVEIEPSGMERGVYMWDDVEA